MQNSNLIDTPMETTHDFDSGSIAEPTLVPAQDSASQKTFSVAEKSVVAPLLQYVNIQLLINLLLVVTIIILIIGAVMIWGKKSDQIILKQNADGVVEVIVNERSFGEVIKPSVQSKGESDDLKVYLAKQFAELAYAVNSETRVDQLRKLLNWFPEDEAKTRTLFSNAIASIKNDPNTCMPTALEVSQGWFSTIKIQEAKLDPANKNLVNILLVQNLQKRLVSNQIENRQLSLQVEFTYLGVPTEENFMTGYAPKFVACRVLPSASQTVANSPAVAQPPAAPSPVAQSPAAPNSAAQTTPNR